MLELNSKEMNQTAGEFRAALGEGAGIILGAAAVVLLAPVEVPLLALGVLATVAVGVGTKVWGWW